MNFLRTRAEHLAEHLRGMVARGSLPPDLPPIRQWSAQLGVSHGTLEEAIRALKREGLVRSRPGQGLFLAARAAPARRVAGARLVRCIAHSAQYRNVPTWPEVLGAIAQQVEAKGIRFRLETCGSAQLRAIHREGARADTLLLLVAQPQDWLSQFARLRRGILLLGLPPAGIDLPYIAGDVIAACRHATHLLARHGFQRISLVMRQGLPGPLDEGFRRICAAAPRRVDGDVVRLPDELHAQSRAAAALATSINGRHALITNAPISPGLLLTAVMRRGLAVPQQVEVVGVTPFAQQLRTVPVPVHYPYPVERTAREVSRAAVHYFERGALPPLRKLIPLEVVVPS